MSDIEPPKKQSKFIPILLAICAVIGAAWTCLQLYSYYNQKEEKIIAIGGHSNFVVPSRFKDRIYNEKDLLSKTVKDLGADRNANPQSRDYLIKLLKLLDLVELREALGQEELKVLNTISTYRQIEITNQGEKEAENISIEIENGFGFYQVGDSPDAPKGKFDQSIPVGNLRPTLSSKVYIWSTDTHYPFRNAFVTYKNGSTKIFFAQDLEASQLNWIWFNYVSYSLIGLVVLAIVFGIGYLIGNKELRLQFEEEQKLLNEFRERKKLSKNTSDSSIEKNSNDLKNLSEEIKIKTKNNK